MNHCRDCNSDYATPGTCNCFAPGGKRHAAPYVPAWPYGPWWIQPYYPTPYYPQYPQWYTTSGNVGGSLGADGGGFASISIGAQKDCDLTVGQFDVPWSYTNH